MPEDYLPHVPASGCGRRLLVHLVDELASELHPRPYASLPRTNDPIDGFDDVSYARFANAVNRCALWMQDRIGRPASLESLAYVGPNDFRYQILSLAAAKAGYMMLFLSPRNSIATFNQLLDKANVTKFLIPSQPIKAVSDIIKSRSMVAITVPDLGSLLDETPIANVPYPYTWEERRMTPFIQIHTSGSTGDPKLVTLKHGNFCAVDALQLLGENEMGRRLGERRMLVTFPMFHVAGLVYGLAMSAWVDSTAVFPPSAPLTADLVSSAHTAGQIDVTLLPPSLITDIASNSDYMEVLLAIRVVTFSGGPLPERVGRMISERTELQAGLGASEFQAVPQLTKDREDWAFFKFNSLEGGYEFRERDPGLYEMVFVRRPELDLVQPIFVTYPELEEYATKDLYSKHPSKPGLWKYETRLDDLIVLSNGEKFNPVRFEGMVSAEPDVRGVLVVGQGRFQTALLIEPKDHDLSVAEISQRIWPYVEQANNAAEKHARLAQDLIIVTDPTRPLPRAGKGTLIRAAANKLYAAEIQEAYERHDTRVQGSLETTQIDLSSKASTMSTMRLYLASLLQADDLKPSDDFFLTGMDSLEVMAFTRAINAAQPRHKLSAKQVYDHPTLLRIVTFLHDTEPVATLQEYDSDDENQKAAWVAMDEMYRSLAGKWMSKPEDRHRKQRMRWLNRATKPGPVIQPDGGLTAWLQILGSFLLNVNNWGLVNSFGAFQPYYESQLLSDRSSSDIALIGTVQGALLLIVGILSGPLFDTGHFRMVLILANLGLVLSLMFLSLARTYYQIFLAQGVLAGLCSGLLYIPSVAVIPIYFKHRRGLALGLATAGGSVGGIIYPIIFRRLLLSTGFGWATRIMGFIVLTTLSLATIVIQPVGARARRQVLDMSAMWNVPYCCFAVTSFLLFASLLVPFFLGPSFAIATMHASKDDISYVSAILNAAQLVGRVLPAAATDVNHRYLGSETILLLAQISLGILGFCWSAVSNTGTFVVWLIFYGFFSGAIATLPATVLPFLCPTMALYGTWLGMLYAFAGAGLLLSIPLAARLNDAYGGFLGCQVWIGSCCFVAAISFIPACIEARKRRLLYENGKGHIRNWKRQYGV